jgi:hypothetical protein
VTHRKDMTKIRFWSPIVTGATWIWPRIFLCSSRWAQRTHYDKHWCDTQRKLGTSHQFWQHWLGWYNYKIFPTTICKVIIIESLCCWFHDFWWFNFMWFKLLWNMNWLFSSCSISKRNVIFVGYQHHVKLFYQVIFPLDICVSFI